MRQVKRPKKSSRHAYAPWPNRRRTLGTPEDLGIVESGISTAFFWDFMAISMAIYHGIVNGSTRSWMNFVGFHGVLPRFQWNFTGVDVNTHDASMVLAYICSHKGGILMGSMLPYIAAPWILSHMLYVWNIYQHLPHKWPKCR